jgi:uncharacterized membrane protein YccF (DUF307 family)
MNSVAAGMPIGADLPGGYGHPAAPKADHLAPASLTFAAPAAQPYPTNAPAWGPPPQPYFSQQTHVNVNVSAPAVVITPPDDGPALIVRALWFICIGWWASLLAITAGYILVYTIIGLPLAFALFNKLPQLTTMKTRKRNWTTVHSNGVTHLTAAHSEQRPLWMRFLYFVVVGWWLGAFWLYGAWILQVLILTLPVALWMYDRAPAVLTLHRH